jgi:hypothetical protein
MTPSYYDFDSNILARETELDKREYDMGKKEMKFEQALNDQDKQIKFLEEQILAIKKNQDRNLRRESGGFNTFITSSPNIDFNRKKNPQTVNFTTVNEPSTFTNRDHREDKSV